MWGLQSPNEVLDWHNDWTSWLEDNDDIYGSDWSIEPDTGEVTAPLLADDTINTAGNYTTVLVSNLQMGQSYQLRNTITTSRGLTGIREITIRCDIQQ